MPSRGSWYQGFWYSGDYTDRLAARRACHNSTSEHFKRCPSDDLPPSPQYRYGVTIWRQCKSPLTVEVDAISRDDAIGLAITEVFDDEFSDFGFFDDFQGLAFYGISKITAVRL